MGEWYYAYDPPDMVNNSASWQYDLLGRVTQESRSVAGNSYTFGYGYTQGNVPVIIVYPGGASGETGESVTSNYYWQIGQPKTHIGDSNYVREAQYNRADGQMTRLNMPTSSVYTMAKHRSIGMMLMAI
ncbi:MAG: hypothetical protein GY796_20245 [Chloroflexi bacterium]|nr:hypothetical protein [Chloroflexota bacterium]